jgi:ATP adenylyltransferase
MTRVDLRHQTGVLPQAIDQTTKQALTCGALQPIDTTQVVIRQAGVDFLVRSVSSLTRKRRAGKQDRAKGPDFNPFLPPEPELTVAQVSDSHLAILNKFNVIERHLLIVTRRFEHQERLLTQADFIALWRCLQEFDGLGFYNGGRVAGASQRHKHLQLVPLPLAPDITGTPMDVIWSDALEVGEPLSLPALPFSHRFLRLPESPLTDPQANADYSLDAYQRMLKLVGIDVVQKEDGEYQSIPYNLLLTRRWMLLVPRTVESFEGISINSLGFVGSLFVPRQADLETVERLGPMRFLKGVTPAANNPL